MRVLRIMDLITKGWSDPLSHMLKILFCGGLENMHFMNI